MAFASICALSQSCSPAQEERKETPQANSGVNTATRASKKAPRNLAPKSKPRNRAVKRNAPEPDAEMLKFFARVPDPKELCEVLSGQPELPNFGRGELLRLEAELKVALADPNRTAVADVAFFLANELLVQGDVDRCVEVLQKAVEIASKSGTPIQLKRLKRSLGIALMRGGETQHCLQEHHSDSCLFPINEKGRWPDKSFALAAIEQFDSVLELYPKDAGVRWLNGIVHMTAGLYDEAATTNAVIPMNAFESPETVPAFRDVATILGLAESRDLAGGAIVDDFDGDGRLDIVVSSLRMCTPIEFYHNEGAAGFSDWSDASKLSEQVGGMNIVQADYDNDGRLDLLIMRGAWQRNWGQQRNSLVRQNEDGTFTDVTREAGLAKVAYPTLGASWSDFDLDGDLDLFFANERLSQTTFSPVELFRNNGDGTFTDITKDSGIENNRNGKATAWGDYDNDGDPDLFLSNCGQPNRLYRNDGGAKFTDVAVELGVADTEPNDASFASWFWDVNNDGWLDLFVGGYGAKSIKDIAADYIGTHLQGERMKLFMNDGKGGFVDRTKAYGLDHARVPMGANFADFDNDGFLDFYLGTGGPYFEMLVPNVLYKNIDGERFVDVTASARVGHLQKGHGVAFGDLDSDGDQDLFAQMGGWYTSDTFPNALFENPGSDHAWIHIRFVGVNANRSAIGTRLTMTIEGPDGERQLHRQVSSGGSFGGSSLQQEIGLGNADRIVKLHIDWPGGVQGQEFSDLPLRTRVTITEGQDDFVVEALAPVQWPK